MWFTLRLWPITLGFTLAVLLSVWVGVAISQTTAGSIYGTVADQTGAVISGATVAITDDQTGITHSATSDGQGNYVFPELQPGSYTASTHAAGFSTEVQKGIRLDVAQNVHVSFVLRPGASGATVTVTAATTLVDTRESQLGDTVDRQRIQDLPLNGRDAFDLVQTVPGVTNYTPNSAIGGSTGVHFVTNGIRPNFNSYYLDGAYDDVVFRNQGNVIPNPDALDQFRLLTSNFDAEFGRSPGGVVNVITRSGTNADHGVVYEYLRNNVLNAKSYFDNEVTPLKQSQFGAAFGGPIKRDKLFFFLSYEGLRVATPEVIADTLTTLTPLESQGNFSASAKKPKLPATTTTGSGAVVKVQCGTAAAPVICPDALDPVAMNLLTYVPLENPITLQPPQQSASANTTANQGMARVDYQLSDKHELSAMFFTSHGISLDPTDTGVNEILDFSGVSNYENQTNAVLSDRWIISPTMLNSLHLFYTLNHSVSSTLFPYTWSSLGSQIKEGSVLTNQPEFVVTGYWTMGLGGNGGASNQASQSIGGLDTFNWTRGRHTIKAGGSFILSHYAQTGVQLGAGEAQFTGGVTGNALADFELGQANSLQQSSGAYYRLHQIDPALFIQDDWRVTNRLTLDLGMRWELYPPFAGQNDLGTFDPNVQSARFPTAPLGLLVSGDPGVPDGILITTWNRFAPRFGFAYDVHGDGKTALRGGYGIFYAVNQANFPEELEQQPFTLATTINETPNLVNPYGNADPYPYVVNLKNPSFVSGATISAMAPHETATPYVQEYNLTVQQQLGVNWGFQLGYVGNVMRKGYLSRDENSPVYVPGASTTTAGLNARRPYEPTPSSYVFGKIAAYDASDNSSYNSLQATLTKRFDGGFSLSASYVWSKLLDYVSQDPANDAGTTLVDENDIGMDYGLSDYDVPQDFVASYLWAEPDVRHWGWVGKQVLSGWQFNGITMLSSGSPFTVTSNVDSNLDGNVNDRPNQIGNPVLSGSRSRSAKVAEFFNTAAFTDLPAGVPYGDVKRNSLIGPGYVDTDFSGFKTFPIRREDTLQFRGEIFNLFDNVNLANPNGVMTAAKYGKITGINGMPRIVQFALRLSF